MEILHQLKSQRVLPVLRYDNEETCFQIAKALYEAGFKLLEITLTNPNPFDTIKKVSDLGAMVGAGTVLNKIDVISSESAGAKFLVSPGISMEVFTAARDRNILLIPGITTPSEIMNALNVNVELLKWFPAGSSGGVQGLKNLRGPFPNLSFIPTGGIQQDEVSDYLKAGATAVGLSPRFLNPKDIESKDWAKVKASAQDYLSIINKS